MKIANSGDVVFEGIATGIYVMAANRYKLIDNQVYTCDDLKDLERMGYKIEIR